MAEWFEVYEDAEGRRAGGFRQRRLVVAFAFVSSAIVAFAPVAALAYPAHSLAVAVAAAVVLSAHAAWLVRRLVSLRRTVWRLDLSVHHVVGHDASGARRVLAWSDVTYVDVADGGLEVTGRRMGRRIQFVVPPGFPDHGRVAHRVVRYAEAFRRPVYVDGRAVESLDVRALVGAGAQPAVR